MLGKGPSQDLSGVEGGSGLSTKHFPGFEKSRKGCLGKIRSKFLKEGGRHRNRQRGGKGDAAAYEKFLGITVGTVFTSRRSEGGNDGEWGTNCC